MSESKDYKKLRDNIFTARDRIDRIENIVVTGMPDVNYCINGFEGWLEIKSPTEPKRASTKLFGSNHKLNQDQKNWFLRQTTAKGRAFILIATDKRWLLMHGAKADAINSMTIIEFIQAATWHGIKPIKEEGWGKLRTALTIR